MRTKKWWIYTACIYIPALFVIGYQYTEVDALIDLSLLASVIGIAIVSYQELKRN